jgi:NAD(P)-dependent dehydrogenase (short-subunit alcohol dehydrogenase family)
VLTARAARYARTPMQRLDGKVAFITGGASGIGKALGEEIASRGGHVVLADRQIDLAKEAARGIVARGGRAIGVELDVRDLSAFERAAREVVNRSGRIDFLFNNAGIAIGGEVDSYERDAWDDVFDVNIKGVAYGIHAVYPHMIAQGSGHIVNTASMAGLVSAAGTGSYCAAKHAVVGITKVLRIEAARHGVRASVVCPGAIRTPIFTGGRFGRVGIPGVTRERVLATWERMRPMEPAVFARRVIDDVLDDVPIIVHPKWWKALWYLDRLSPSLGMKVWSMILEKMRNDFAREGIVVPPRRPPLGADRDRAS